MRRYRQLVLCRLDNFNPCGLAAVQDAPAAARIFVRLIHEVVPLCDGATACDVCNEVVAQENLRIREFAGYMPRSDVSHWLRTNATLCVPRA
jgi:hypothetical protein